MLRLLEGPSSPVYRLFRPDHPFTAEAPRFVRMSLFAFGPESPAKLRAEGRWWNGYRAGLFLPPVSAEDAGAKWAAWLPRGPETYWWEQQHWRWVSRRRRGGQDLHSPLHSSLPPHALQAAELTASPVTPTAYKAAWAFLGDVRAAAAEAARVEAAELERGTWDARRRVPQPRYEQAIDGSLIGGAVTREPPATPESLRAAADIVSSVPVSAALPQGAAAAVFTLAHVPDAWRAVQARHSPAALAAVEATLGCLAQPLLRAAERLFLRPPPSPAAQAEEVARVATLLRFEKPECPSVSGGGGRGQRFIISRWPAPSSPA